MEDTEIVNMYTGRDEAALNATDAKYGRVCRGISRAILKNSEDSEECVNDAYLRLWQSIPPQRPVNLGAYLYKTVRNISIARLRKNQAGKRGGGETDLILDELGECLGSGGSAEDECLARELGAAVREFVLSLPENERLIFTGRYWLSLPVKEIAASRGLKASYVATVLCRSREKLRKYLIREGLL